MAKSPSSVLIAGIPFSISYQPTVIDPDGGKDHLSGLTNGDSREIKVSTTENKTEDQRSRTLFHEMIHAVLYVSGISQILKDEDQEEALVICLENLLWALMQFRKGIFK